MAIHDLTDRVRQMGERWRRTFDAMVDGVALVDPDGEIVLANQALGHHLQTLRPVVFERQRSGEAGEWRTPSDGRLLACMLTSPEGFGHSILVARDVTDAVRSEARLREADKMQAVGTLASGVAHDFNNLLAAIQLHVRWLNREPAAAEEAATAIGDLADEGIEVVRELLLFARRESTQPRTFDLAALVSGQESMLSHMIPDGVSLVARVSSRPVPVVGNPVALRRLLLNLVLNARDAVSRQDGQVEVTVSAKGDEAILWVADNGTGISAEHLARLFEPFFSLKRHGRGAGLGLAVVYAIVNEHGGEIDVESDGRSGSRFVVRFPLGRAADLEPLEGDVDPSHSDESERVLLVDDDGREAVRLVEAFAAAGLEVRHATTIEAARSTAADWSPTAVVSLLELPDAAALPWLADLGLQAVVLVPDGSERPKELPGDTTVLERSAAPEAILAALQRLGLPVVG
jgi:signal transduction histidine kinase